jgi:ankyrin repeat protein
MDDGSLDQRLYYSCRDGLLTDALRHISNGANVNWANPKENNSTALYVASFNGHADVVDALARAGADVDACNQAGLFSLFIAAQYVS